MKAIAQDRRLTVVLAILASFMLGMQVPALRSPVPAIKFSEPDRSRINPPGFPDGRCVADGDEARRNTNRLLDQHGNFLTTD